MNIVERTETTLTRVTLSPDEVPNLVKFLRALPGDHPAKPAAEIIAQDLDAALVAPLPANTGILLLLKLIP